MSEIPDKDPNQSVGREELRSFSELLAKPEIVYHGIGADLMALQGIATHGIATVAKQMELTGNSNSNTPRDAAWNGENKISVATVPQPGLPNVAFMNYIEDRPISFAVDSNTSPVETPSARGIFDEAFIDGASVEAIIGIVLDGNAIDKPIAEMPIVGSLTTADTARGFMSFLIKDYDPEIESDLPKLEELISNIKYSVSPFMANNDSRISSADEQSIERINGFLQNKLALALEKKFGRSDQTILETVRSAFPSKTLYVNNHDNGIKLYDEDEYFDTLSDDAVIGYQRWDGGPNGPSIYKVRRALRRADRD